ncbi:Ribosomal L28 family [Zea mays]|uniref:Large ribosomal subunit protein bL28m n=1 Tax=Zea mays TaxID=4577 RepID=A0A1D6EXL1_MAIZE|nr:Ribosomal L28 family [Zea mays]
MSFRAREMYKKVVRRLGGEGKLPAELMKSVKDILPDSNVVMGRAKRGIFAGRHIRFGNKVSEDGGNKSRRSWKPNVQEKRLFSYVHDQHIRVKVTTHALRCIDKAGGIDEYLLKTPYNKMDTEMGIVWKANIEKMYSDLAEIEVGFFPPEVEAKIKKGLDEVRAAKRDFRREGRRALAKQSQLEASSVGDDQTSEVIDTKQVFAAKIKGGGKSLDAPGQIMEGLLLAH